MNSQVNFSDDKQKLIQRIDELEIRTVYLEDTVDGLNQQLAKLTQEFLLAKDAMRLINQRLQQMQDNQATVKDFSEETPPPHY